jgi:hypothetical protein
MLESMGIGSRFSCKPAFTGAGGTALPWQPPAFRSDRYLSAARPKTHHRFGLFHFETSNPLDSGCRLSSSAALMQSFNPLRLVCFIHAPFVEVLSKILAFCLVLFCLLCWLAQQFSRMRPAGFPLARVRSAFSTGAPPPPPEVANAHVTFKLVDYVDKLDDKRGQENRASFAHVAETINSHFKELNSKIDSQFKEVNSKSEAQFKEVNSKSEAQFKEMNSMIDAKIDKLSKDLDSKIEKLDTEFKLTVANIGSAISIGIEREKISMGFVIGGIAIFVGTTGISFFQHFGFRIEYPSPRTVAFPASV